MKGTEEFEKTIKAHLDQRAQNDMLFYEKYGNEKKNLKDCVTYILNTVKNSGCSGFTDDEIFGMAIHYYDEESIDVGLEINSRVVVNHIVELTDNEKAEARENAMKRAEDEFLNSMKKKQPKKEEKTTETTQTTLFDE